MFSDIADGLWQHATCPVILLVCLLLVRPKLDKLADAIADLHGSIKALPPPAQTPAPIRPQPPGANGVKE